MAALDRRRYDRREFARGFLFGFGGRAFVERRGEAARSGDIENLARLGRADAGDELQRTEAGMRSLAFCAQRKMASTSLTCAASRNFSPPYLTNGMSRRCNSSSSVALASDARNSTAWVFSSWPHSRA